MNTSVIDRTTPAATEETFIVRKGDEGYRVCSTRDPSKQFTVTGLPDDPQCDCPDFAHPDRPPEWQCKHILAVLKSAGEMPVNRVNGTPVPAGSRGADGPPARTEKKAPNGRNGRGAVMLLKRSVSPDGRIDSLSVEFSCPVGSVTTAAIKQQAATILALQGEITAGFLKTNGNGSNGKPAPKTSDTNGATDSAPGRLLAVAAMNGKWGKRLFLNILVNGKVLKFFGTEQQLAGALADAGYPEVSSAFGEGMTFNLPCQVVTKPSPDGKYLNVERILPAPAAGGTRG